MPTDSPRSLERFKAEFPPQNATRETEAALCARIQAGDEDAIGELVLPHLRFCLSIAGKYHSRHRNIPLEDLNVAAIMGMLKAARRFDASRGNRFCSYAVAWCKQGCQDTVARFRAPVAVPISAFQGFAKAWTFYDRPENFRRRPSSYDAEEIAQDYDTPLSYIASALVHFVHHTELDAPTSLSDGEGSARMDFLVSPAPLPDHALSESSRRHLIEQMLSSLPQRTGTVLRRYFLDGVSLDAIAGEMGVCRERIRQLKNKALDELRAKFEAEALAELQG